MIYIFYLPSINLMGHDTELTTDTDLEPIHVFNTSQEYSDYMGDTYGSDEFPAPAIGVAGMTLKSDVEGLKPNRTLPASNIEITETGDVTEILVFNTEYEIRLDDYLYEFYRPFIEYIKADKRNTIIDDLL